MCHMRWHQRSRGRLCSWIAQLGLCGSSDCGRRPWPSGPRLATPPPPPPPNFESLRDGPHPQADTASADPSTTGRGGRIICDEAAATAAADGSSYAFAASAHCRFASAMMRSAARSTSAIVVWRPVERRRVPMPYSAGTSIARRTDEMAAWLVWHAAPAAHWRDKGAGESAAGAVQGTQAQRAWVRGRVWGRVQERVRERVQGKVQGRMRGRVRRGVRGRV